MSHFIFLIAKNETQTYYSGMLSFSYLKRAKHNACFKEFGKVDISEMTVNINNHDQTSRMFSCLP